MHVVSGRLPLATSVTDDVYLKMQQGHSPADNPDTAEQAAAQFDCRLYAEPELCSLFRKRLAAAQARLLQVPNPCQSASSNLHATYTDVYTALSAPVLCSGTDNHA